MRDLAAGDDDGRHSREPGAAGAIASDGASGFQISADANCAVFASELAGLVAGLTQTDFAADLSCAG